MTTELVIRDSVSDQLLAVAWQEQNDPRRGELEMTTNFSNVQVFRLMSQDFADWVFDGLDEVRAAP